MSGYYIIDGGVYTGNPFNFADFFSADGPFSTSSSTYVPAASFSTNANNVAGDYLVSWNCTYTNSANNSRVGIRVQIDNSITINDRDYGVRGAPRAFTASGKQVVTMTAGSHTIDVDFRAFSATSTINQIEILIYRIS